MKKRLDNILWKVSGIPYYVELDIKSGLYARKLRKERERVGHVVEEECQRGEDVNEVASSMLEALRATRRASAC